MFNNYDNFFRWDHKKRQSHKVLFTAMRTLKSGFSWFFFGVLPRARQKAESGFTLILSAGITHLAKKTPITRCISYVTKCLLNLAIVKTHCKLTDPHNASGNYSPGVKTVVCGPEQIFTQGNYVNKLWWRFKYSLSQDLFLYSLLTSIFICVVDFIHYLLC